ncbi:hypothetical protein [Herbidospora sp. RD11066]
MDATVLAALAGALGAGVVEAMATDAWQAVRGRVVRIVGRGSQAREEEAAVTLEAGRATLLAADDSDLRASLMRSMSAEWTNNIKVILIADPALVADVKSAVRFIELTLRAPGGAVTQSVISGRDAFTAGGDQHININSREDHER